MTTAYAPDKNVGFSAYERLAANELLVSSVWYSIQGEGPLAGCPAMFVRLAGCNRGAKNNWSFCQFCDAAFELENGKTVTFEGLNRKTEVEYSIHKNKTSHNSFELLVITGGEPFLQLHKDNPNHGLMGFISYWLNCNPERIVQIETNGDYLDRWYNNIKCVEHLAERIYVVCSPKMNLKKTKFINDSGWYYNTSNLLQYREEVDAFKFLYDSTPESPYNGVPEAFIDEVQTDDELRTKIYVSPIAYYLRHLEPNEVANMWDHSLIDVERTRKNYAAAALYCMEYGFRLNTQQHLLISQP